MYHYSVLHLLLLQLLDLTSFCRSLLLQLPHRLHQPAELLQLPVVEAEQRRLLFRPLEEVAEPQLLLLHQPEAEVKSRSHLLEEEEVKADLQFQQPQLCLLAVEAAFQL
jgi:hypothetical protein